MAKKEKAPAEVVEEQSSVTVKVTTLSTTVTSKTYQVSSDHENVFVARLTTSPTSVLGW